MCKNLLDEFRQFEDELEKLSVPASDVDKLHINHLQREERWLEKRSGKITSSVCPGLMKGGRGANVEWGEVSKKVLLAVIHERITGTIRPNLPLYQFEWGHMYEPEAIEYYAKHTKQNVINCNLDKPDIVFLERDDIPNYGDSPDALVIDNSLIKVTIEMKCPESGSKHMEYCGMNAISEKDDYYWQMVSHLLAAREAERLDFVSFDPRFPDGHPLKMHIVSMYRKDHEDNLIKLWARIGDANYILDMAEKTNAPSVILNVDNILSQRK